MMSLRICLLFLVALPSSFAVAQEAETLPPLTGDEKQAMKEIDQRRVTSTISFLASDELGGRDTPSTGLNIASAYVASRFQGAGLEGLGDQGSFYQSTDVATLKLPESANVSTPAGDVNVLGVLSANNESFSFNGQVTLVDDDTPRDQEFTGPVTLVVEPFTGMRDQSNFLRRLTRLRQKGATAILVQAGADHPLVGSAVRAATQPRLVRSRGGLVGPVILIQPKKLEGEVTIALDKQTTGQATVKNVIGVLKGSDPELAKEAIIFSAHLDHIGQSGFVGDTINNGADDDATGVTAVLSLADAYAALEARPKRSVIFMTFWGEEKGLLGSRYYAKSPTWPLEKTIANINLEMLGRPEAGANEKTWMTGWNQSDLGQLMNQGAKRADVLVFEHPQFSAMLYRASDNYSFVEKGVIAHSFSAGSLHSDYHQPSDEWEKLELKHMTRVIEGLFAGSLPIAHGKLTPRKTEGRR